MSWKLHLLIIGLYWAYLIAVSEGWVTERFWPVIFIVGAVHYTAHWVIRMARYNDREVDYPSTHRDLRRLHDQSDE